MTLYELNEIIENGENQKVEFKRKFTEPEKIAKEIDLPINRAATICEYIISNSEIDPRRIAILGNHTNANDKDTIEINVQKK